MAYDREQLAERLHELKHQAAPRASLALLQAASTWRPLEGKGDDVRAIVDQYLRVYAMSDCPGCDHGAFAWGLVYGQGKCVWCGWPGTLYHYVRDPRPDALCDGCSQPRSDHEQVEVTWIEVATDRPVQHRELRCPVAGAGIGYYQAPTLVRFDGLLWAHPYTVHLTRTAKEVPA